MQQMSDWLVPSQIDLSALLGLVQHIGAFVLVFGVLVFIHELGHFLVAKWSGVKVHEFALGFGPAIVSRRVGETLYALRMIPLGGFVKLAGIEPTENLPEEARGDEVEDGERAFHRHPVSHRLAILAAGPLMNLLLAVLIFAGLFMTTAPVIHRVLEGSPAEAGGLLPGDALLAVDGEIDLFSPVGLIRRAGERPVELTLLRNGERITVTVTPRRNAEGVPMVGIELTQGPTAFYRGFGESFVAGAQLTGAMLREFFSYVRSLVVGEAEPELAGPVGIFQLTGDAAAQGWSNLAVFTALLSINLAVFNLLPIPILDGGGMLFVLIEAVRGRPLRPEAKGMAQMVGLTLLLLLTLFATAQDLGRLFGS